MMREHRTMNKYAALDPINYDKIHLNTHYRLRKISESCEINNATSLTLLCCEAICRHGGASAAAAVRSLPSHLAATLLQQSVASMHTAAMTSIVSNWPLPVLCFREVLPDPTQWDIFEEDMGLNVTLFKGIIGLDRKSRLRLLDLRGFELNWNFTKLIIQMWPLLSLKKYQRNVKRLTNLILKTAGLKKDNRLALEIIPRLLEDLLKHDMANHPAFNIALPKGEKLVVKIDHVEFSTQNTFFMEYLMTNCLRSITPLVIDASNIIIKSDLNIGDEILDSLAPFIAFRGQDTETLQGIWIENLEDNVFFIMCQDIQGFSNLTGLCLPNCNITLQEGRTRQRTAGRQQITSMLNHFTHLTRLDLAQNSFTGCLKEVLDAVTLPLEYLSLKECDLCDRDIEDLAGSQHATSIRNLDLSRICGLFPDDSFAVSTSTLLRSLKNFTNLTLVHLQQNQISDSNSDELCGLISQHWPKLRGVDIAENILSVESVTKIARACIRTKIHYLQIPYFHNFLEHWSNFEAARQAFQRRIMAEFKGAGREDMDIQVCGLAFAVLGNVQPLH